VNDYGDIALGVECALPRGYTDHGSGRAAGDGKEAGPASGAAPLLWQRHLIALTILPSTSSMAWSQRAARRGS
jgi:hypothetical protein